MPTPAAMNIGANPYFRQSLYGLGMDPEEGLKPRQEPTETAPSEPARRLSGGPLDQTEADRMLDQVTADLRDRPLRLTARIHLPGQASLLGHNYV